MDSEGTDERVGGAMTDVGETAGGAAGGPAAELGRVRELVLQAHPDVTVDLVDGRRHVRGHAATGDERSRLWARWREINTNLDAYAALRPSETAVVVLERE